VTSGWGEEAIVTVSPYKNELFRVGPEFITPADGLTICPHQAAKIFFDILPAT
jgi:hypothetical protein